MNFSDVRRAMAIAITETEGTSTHWAIHDLWWDWCRINNMKSGEVLYWYYRNGGTAMTDDRFDESLTKCFKECWVIECIGEDKYRIE